MAWSIKSPPQAPHLAAARLPSSGMRHVGASFLPPPGTTSLLLNKVSMHLLLSVRSLKTPWSLKSLPDELHARVFPGQAAVASGRRGRSCRVAPAMATAISNDRMLVMRERCHLFCPAGVSCLRLGLLPLITCLVVFQVFVPPHPLIKHWVSVLRNEETPSAVFSK